MSLRKKVMELEDKISKLENSIDILEFLNDNPKGYKLYSQFDKTYSFFGKRIEEELYLEYLYGNTLKKTLVCSYLTLKIKESKIISDKNDSFIIKLILQDDGDTKTIIEVYYLLNKESEKPIDITNSFNTIKKDFEENIINKEEEKEI